MLDQLHAGGWNVGDTAFFDVEDGSQVWVVTGTNGENMIRAEGATCAEAWWHTLDRASAVGVLPGWPRPAPAALPIQAKQPGMPTVFPVITATDGPFGHGSAISAPG